ncbi:DsbC family protein [Geopsychrobacter electrodiphilus]|uniref:DsbC family protein n=1 Tax=Geopsychrobacter electrodiphilus TaxID=225196 RepID=UPI00146DBC94|nr:DsbC family protein [Geopsychrobacter electrodiphilus]
MLKVFFTIAMLLISLPASAFMPGSEGCGAGSCIDCHTLSSAEANDILKQIEGEVVGVSPAEVPGLWRIDMRMKGKTWPLYLDYSKSYLISGNVIQLDSRQNLTENHYRELNPIDIASIPLDDALLLGDPLARIKIIVFTDPHCPYCSKLHQELKKALEVRPDIAWLIKLMPIKKGSREAAETILCEKSLSLLDDAFAGHQLAPPGCKNKSIDMTLKIAAELGIHSTPTLIMPNGQMLPGYKKLDQLLQAVDENTPAQNASIEKKPNQHTSGAVPK